LHKSTVILIPVLNVCNLLKFTAFLSVYMVVVIHFYLFRLQHNGSWIHIQPYLHARKTTGN